MMTDLLDYFRERWRRTWRWPFSHWPHSALNVALFQACASASADWHDEETDITAAFFKALELAWYQTQPLFSRNGSVLELRGLKFKSRAHGGAKPLWEIRIWCLVP